MYANILLLEPYFLQTSSKNFWVFELYSLSLMLWKVLFIKDNNDDPMDFQGTKFFFKEKIITLNDFIKEN